MINARELLQQEEVLASMKMFAEEVMPHFK